ncbi:MAG: hypothetical protein ACREBG_11970 [Pyrinomonadaceae bacterium]
MIDCDISPEVYFILVIFQEPFVLKRTRVNGAFISSSVAGAISTGEQNGERDGWAAKILKIICRRTRMN